MIPFLRCFFRTFFFCTIAAFYFSGVSSYAQQTKIDSLKKLIKADAQDTNKTKHYTQLSWTQKNLGMYKEARENAKLALDLSNELKHKKGAGDAYNTMGVILLEQGDYRAALDNFLLTYEIRNEMSDLGGLAAVYNNLGLVYEYLGNPGKALENYFAAIKINKETGNKNWLANNYNNIGNIYSEKGSLDLALENYLSAKKLKEELGETKNAQYANTIGNIGNVYFFKQDLNKALEIFRSALALRTEIGSKKGMADSHIAIGSVYFEQVKNEANPARRDELYKKALESFSTGLKLEEEIGDMFGVSITRMNMGSVYYKQNKIADARKEFLASLDISKENDSKDMMMSLYQLLAQCDSVDGNWLGAYQYQKLHKQFSDSLFNEANSKKMAEMSTLFETEKKETQISTLEKDKKQTRFLIIVFVVLVSGLFLLARRAYNNKKKIAEFMATESERKEVLLQEVHHRINNNLQIISSLLALQANSAEDEKLHEYLKQSQNRIYSLSSLHELLYQTDSHLKINMNEYLNKVLDFHRDVLNTLPGKVEMIVDIQGEDFATRLAVPLALIVNELVTNSLKYAFADGKDGFIKISLLPLHEQQNQWRLTVSDSGKGLPDTTKFRKDSLGLRLVNIMTKQIKGTLTKTNSPGATFQIDFVSN